MVGDLGMKLILPILLWATVWFLSNIQPATKNCFVCGINSVRDSWKQSHILEAKHQTVAGGEHKHPNK